MGFFGSLFDRKLTKLPPVIQIPGLIIKFWRDAGTCLQYQVAFEKDADIKAIADLLRQLKPQHEVSFDGAGVDEWLEARFTGTHFEIKTAHHGAYGHWKWASFDEAVDHLRPALRHRDGPYSSDYGWYYLFCEDKKSA